jgi:hypothetical protein
MRKLFFLTLFLTSYLTVFSQEYTISGYITDEKTGEELIGAAIKVKGTNLGSVTNVYGYYSLTLPAGDYTVAYDFIGYNEIEKPVKLNKSIRMDIKLAEASEIIDEIELTGVKENENITTTQMSVTSLSSKEIKKMPALLGETDIIRSLTLLPGISTVGEISTGFNVRGGNADQNLILLDEAPVFNSSHLLGLFSVFNSDVIKDAKLYKGGIPAIYGGRLSSVLDVRQKDGNTNQFSGSGGIGLLSSRLMLEGPIVKEKVNFIVAGRRSYFDIFFPISNDPAINQSILYFYDLNAKVSYKINNKNRLFLSGYFGQDNFGIQDQFNFGWGNTTGTLRWNSLLNDKLFMNLSLIYSDYKYNLGTPTDAETVFRLDSRIQNYIGNLSFSWYPNAKNKVDFGLNTTYYTFSPGKISGEIEAELSKEYAFEPALFIANEQTVTDRLKINYGLRFSSFFNVGPRTVTVYEQDQEIETENAIGTVTYERGEIVKSYVNLDGFEPRIAFNYLLDESNSVKLSYNRIRQYIHLVSNTTNATPIDIWRPSGTYIKPATVHQIAGGYFKNFAGNKLKFSIEGYYKKFYDLLEYKDGADLIFTESIETELLSGEGEAYGAEVLLEKKSGKLTGFIGYTLSRSTRLVKGNSTRNTVNQGQPYLANFDKTHDLSILITWAVSKKWDLSAAFAYQTGRPLTAPDGKGQFEDFSYPIYSTRNSARIPDYHRLDLSAVYYFKNNFSGKRWKTNLAFGVYNAYGRKNPYSITFVEGDSPTQLVAQQLSIFGSIIPYVTFNFSF